LRGGSAAKGGRGGGKDRPHKPDLDEMGIAVTHEVKPASSPRSKLGRPGMRGGFKSNRRRRKFYSQNNLMARNNRIAPKLMEQVMAHQPEV